MNLTVYAYFSHNSQKKYAFENLNPASYTGDEFTNKALFLIIKQTYLRNYI